MSGKGSEIRRMKRRWRLVVSVVLGTLFLASAFIIDGVTLRGFALSFAPTVAPSARVFIAVEGMHCDSCAAGIRVTLRRTSGVISAEVSYQRKEAVVDYDPEKITPNKIVETINNLGYKAKIKG